MIETRISRVVRLYEPQKSEKVLQRTHNFVASQTVSVDVVLPYTVIVKPGDSGLLDFK